MSLPKSHRARLTSIKDAECDPVVRVRPRVLTGRTGKELKEHANCEPDHAVGLFVQVARAEEIRQATFPNVMLGTWAETAEQCAAKDKTNIVIEPTKYRDG